MRTVTLPFKTEEPFIDLALDTIEKNKQALIFVNAKRSAEKCAEDLAKKIKQEDTAAVTLSEKLLNVLSKPTHQCERLAKCCRKGIVFHHAGLHAEQKDLIEQAFRQGTIRIICCTPTLCITSSTPIFTDKGVIKVAELVKGVKVLSLQQNNVMFTPIIDVVRHSAPDQIVQIETVYGHTIRLTFDHRILIKRCGKQVYLPARTCKRNDIIATTLFVPVMPKNYSLYDFVKDNRESVLNRRLMQEDYYVIGAMLGDGYSGAEYYQGIKYKGSPCIVGKEKVLDIVFDWCKKHNIKCRKSINYSGVNQLVLSKKNWLREFFLMCGIDKGAKKNIAKKLLASHEECIAALLRGLFDTDGYVEKRGHIGITSISRQLIDNIRYMLLRFGITGRVRKHKKGVMHINSKKYATKPQWELIIAGTKDLRTFAEKISFSLPRKNDALKKIIQKINMNILSVTCNNCSYTLYSDTFDGRTLQQTHWGQQKKQIIKTLAIRGPLSSRALTNLLKFVPRKNEKRLNHHYAFISKKKQGNKGWIWQLNHLGNIIYHKILKKNISLKNYIYRQDKCPICHKHWEKNFRGSWEKYVYDGDIFWDKIKSIKSINNTEEVYDIVLNQNRSRQPLLCANGVFIHNSAGLDLPAFRAIIRDLKRYVDQRGLTPIPVLEYLQMAGRAGRPKYDVYGEAITLASTESEVDAIMDKYILGEPEEIYSKLAVEPVLRTYLLSLIASEIIQTPDEITRFFQTTFWAHQFKNVDKLNHIISDVLTTLVQWTFLKQTPQRYTATLIGRRVAQLYVDPLTAHGFIEALKRTPSITLKPTSWIHLVCNTLEMRPLLRVKAKEYNTIQSALIEQQLNLLQKEPDMYDPDYEDYLHAYKTTMMLGDWINEKDEEYLLETYDVRPGETRTKLKTADWLLYALSEIALLLQQQPILKEIAKTRTRLQYGVKEEVLPLLRLEGIGRVRARKLFANKIKDLGDIRTTPLEQLALIIGKTIAENIKKQVGQ